MFEKKYKSAMNKTLPSEEALNKTLSAMKEEADPRRRRKLFIKRSVICVAALSLVFASVFTAFKVNDFFRYSGEKEGVAGYGKLVGLKAASSKSEITGVISDYYRAQNSIADRFLGGFANGNIEVDYIEEVAPDAVVDEEQAEETVKTDDEITYEGSFYNKDVPEHSDTNNQVIGVQEADIVKNDGRYIYFCSPENKMLYITEAKDGKMSILSKTKLKGNIIKEMLLLGNKLAVISEYTNGTNGGNDTICIFYDITDRSKPELVNEGRQSGDYISSRAIDGHVYIISAFRQYRKNDEILPEYDGSEIEAQCTYIPDEISNTNFTIVTSFDTNADGCDNTDVISILSMSSIIYSAKENLYLTAARSIYDSENTELNENQTVPTSKTDIYRIELKEGKMKPTAFGNIPGTLKDQFSIDESDGILRIASNINYATVVKRDNLLENVLEGAYRFSFSETCNKVFCLNEDLDVIGESEALGITEQIKSVRYIGDIAYVVTFRQTDPLYAIDLSDPENPKTLSELKIDGFSTYMHPFGNGLLLGIGYDADSKYGGTTGLKLTMFDISDPTATFDISSCILSWENGYSDSSALYNHKATLIDAKKNIIAIPISEEYCNTITEDGYSTVRYGVSTYFVFFEFDGKTLTEQKRITVCENADNFFSSLRGLYIGDYGYLTHNDGIISIRLDTFETVDEIKYSE